MAFLKSLLMFEFIVVMYIFKSLQLTSEYIWHLKNEAIFLGNVNSQIEKHY